MFNHDKCWNYIEIKPLFHAAADEDGNEAGPFLDWILPISYAALLIQTAIQNGEVKPLLLQNKSMLFVTLGYDDGDYINLPALTA